MQIQNSEIAKVLNQMADLLDIQGANPFRIRAYRNAAQTLLSTQASIVDMIARDEDLSELPGIGKDLGGKICEIAEVGTFADLAAVAKKLPASLVELMTLPSLGPKKSKTLYSRLHIKNLDDLRRSCEAGKVQKLKGFGPKTEARILEEINRLQAKGPERTQLAVAAETVARLEKHLRAAPGMRHVSIAGSFRRQMETVGDLDFLVTASDKDAVMEHFAQFEGVVKVLARGPTKTSAMLRSGLQVDLRAVDDESYGAALLYFTGSKAHNIALRARAMKKKLKINEYGVFRGEKRIASRTEEEVYAAVGLPWIDPEMRENRGEIEAAVAGRLPKLVRVPDIRGDLHAHTQATDGVGTLEEMAEAAMAKGYQYLAITDHTLSTRVAGGIDARAFRRQWAQMERLNARYSDFALLKSAEVDILEDGTLDLPNEVLKEMDIVVCSIHARFKLDREKQTERVLRAMENPYFQIWAHPTGRLIGKREPYEIDLERIVAQAARLGRILEINSQPDRMDLPDIYVRMAKEKGVKMVISTDSHHPEQLNWMRFGVGVARRGWLEKTDVINTMSLKQLRKFLGARR